MSEQVMLTCALPLYKSSEIAWLCLESLCNQQDVDFPWELVVCEEIKQRGSIRRLEGVLGEKALLSYEERLRDAGCVSIKYIPLEKWVPLSDKWVEIAEHSCSRFFLLCAADDYFQPLRLRETVDVFLSDQSPDWVQSPLGAFYDIITGYTSIYDNSLYSYPTALNMAVKTQMAKCLKREGVKKGVDRWMFSSIRGMLGREPVIGVNASKSWMLGAYTHGYNMISRGRRKYIGTKTAAPKPPFRLAGDGEPDQIHQYLPQYICEMIMELSREREYPPAIGPAPRGILQDVR